MYSMKKHVTCFHRETIFIILYGFAVEVEHFHYKK